MKEVLINFYKLLKTPTEAPAPWGAFHIFCLIAVIFAAILLVRLFSNVSELGARAITLVFWVIIAVFEICKQFSCGLTLVDGELVLSYPWGIFPYQFCSTPLYIMPIVIFAKDGKLRDAAIVFLATFAFIGGAAIYIAPNSVFTTNLFLNIQTMVHHGVQIFFGVYMAFRYYDKLTLKGFLRGAAMFLILCGIALAFNIATHHILPSYGVTETPNMFFISPYRRYVPDVLQGMGIENMTYESYLFAYLTIFISCAFLVMHSMKALERLTRYDR